MSDRTTPMPRWRSLLAVLAVAATSLIAIGCGSGGDDPAEADQPAASTAEAPAPGGPEIDVSSLLLPAGSLDAELEKLKGQPVVVNQWASWCPPCRDEFPFFQEAAADLEGEIAFLGIDLQDNRSDAEEFLAEFPVPYPSVEDPDGSATAAVGGGVGSPYTAFFDEKGEMVGQYFGAYPDTEALLNDIDTYLR